MKRDMLLNGWFIFGILLLFSLGQLSCSGSDDPVIVPCPEGTTVEQIAESEPNDQSELSDEVDFWIPKDSCTSLQIMGTVKTDGSFLGGPNADMFDFFSFVLLKEGTYSFKLSELTAFDLDLNLFTEESILGNEIPGVNFFSSPINAPFEGNIEFFSADLERDVVYFIRVKSVNTGDSWFSYSVFVEQEQQ